MTTFQTKVADLILAKRSNLSVGLDPGLPGQVTEDAVPADYLAGKPDYDGLVDFCLDIVDKAADHAVTIKITQPYVMGLSDAQHKVITDRIRQRGALSIYDMKLGSILRTAFAALWYVHRWGYDAVTITPLLGDNEATIKAAKELSPSLATLVYVISSGHGMTKYVGAARVGSTPVAQHVISDIRNYEPDGCLFGAGKLVSAELLGLARQSLGDESVFVFVIGNDEQEAKRLMKASAPTGLMNVGRDIIYAPDPRKKAADWVTKLRSF